MKIFTPLALALVSSMNVSLADEWYQEMHIGPVWSNTFEHLTEGKSQNAILKGLLVDLGERKKHALFDTETLRWVTAYDGFVTWGGTPWTGSHGGLVRVDAKKPTFATATAVGWADAAGKFDDPRSIPGHGNLSSAHGRFLGYYMHGDTVCISSEIHGARVLETLESRGDSLHRHLAIAARPKELLMLIADEKDGWEVDAKNFQAKSTAGLSIAVGQIMAPALLKADGSRLYLSIPAGNETLTFQVAHARGSAAKIGAAVNFTTITSGGKPRYPDVLETAGTLGKKATDSAWVVDQIAIPKDNPWKANMRICAFDFLSDDALAITTWNGDVWKVSGIAKDMSKIEWRRIASGLFEPLGLKVVDGVIHVLGRDGITKLIDQNGDGETDFYQAFNRDVIITRNFHEFAFDLHTDKEGNFYFCKGSPVRGGGRGFDKILPNNGIVAKVSKDGKKFEVVATGLRAPGGMSVGPDGQITTGENEGSWQPCCKLNYAMPSQFPVFFGTEPSRHEICKDRPFTEPLCYFPMDVDNSGGSQVWVPEGANFGLNAGELIHLSYGKSTLYRVLPEKKGDVTQGGVVAIPARLSSSAMRARFHKDGSLFVAGFRGWQTNAANEMGLQRVRYVKGETSYIPSSLKTTPTGVIIGFDVELDDEIAEDLTSYTVERWNYVRGPQYGSGHFSVDQPDVEAEKKALEKESKDHRKQDEVEVISAKRSSDKKSIVLELRGMKPSMTLKVAYELETADGDVLNSTVYSTVK